MARRRYRRYRRRVTRWSPNIQEILTTQLVPSTEGINSTTYTLAFNPTQTNTAVSQLYTVKRFNISFVFEGSTTSQNYEDICAYVMYVPQGMNVTTDYNLQHPEYIMASKFIGSPYTDLHSAGQQFQPHRISTSLSRKLNTGDSVVLFIKYNVQGQPTAELTISGIARWWTKAN